MTQANQDKTDERAELLKRSEELRQRLAQIEQDYRKGLPADSEEQSIQLENAEVLAGIARATAEELERVEARLAELS
ncbi:MAG: hypothetical protein P8Z75_06940 [Gammaproteobacteria bacterium]|jgi:hypothetical protein